MSRRQLMVLFVWSPIGVAVWLTFQISCGTPLAPKAVDVRVEWDKRDGAADAASDAGRD